MNGHEEEDHPDAITSASFSTKKTINNDVFTPAETLTRTLSSDEDDDVPFSLLSEVRSNISYHSSDYFGWSTFTASRLSVKTVINAGLYTFSFSLLTTASFGLLFSVDTKGTWGPAQAFLSGGMTGLFMTLFGGQPLVLFGQTGPITLLYTYAYEFCHTQDIKFYGFVGWMGVWSALQHFAIAIAGLNDKKYLNYVTRFTGEIFELLVAADYITAAIIGFYDGFRVRGCPSIECAGDLGLRYLNGSFSLLLGLSFWIVAMWLQGSNTEHGMRWGTFAYRRFFGQFGCMISLVVFTTLSYATTWDATAGWPESIPSRVPIASEWGVPSLDLGRATREMGAMEVGHIFVAIIPAVFLTVLFYVDQNLSTLMAVRDISNTPLKSKDAYNMDFFLLGVTVLFTGLLGLPASSGLIPQNPMHSKALIVLKEEFGDNTTEVAVSALKTPSASSSRDSGDIVDVEEGGETAAVGVLKLSTIPTGYVVEQRISNLIHSGLLLLFIVLLPIVGFIPRGVLWGAFLLLAAEAYGAQFVQRALLAFTSNKSRDRTQWDDIRDVVNVTPHRETNIFTTIQFILWFFVFIIAVILKIPFPMADGNTWVVVGSIFPILICLCALFRFTLLPKFVDEDALLVLDPHEARGRAHPAVKDKEE
ncbi:hypothetical protein TrST_g9773 [Triparma strigata]|uniref:Bicarbonate transporter-like transmembrane domain-containing protein n=1 Tax=Triparma strigata TaxID=1606541 RepID=A0A9W6ZQ31_9STRA|nr:hypothetical protein TrST_g9773 [Triparma strigata]